LSDKSADGNRMYEDLFKLDGQIVVVTGGAGHLGREISKGLADFGAHVVALGRNAERFADLAGKNIECVKCDVQDEVAFAAVVSDIRKHHGRLDGLVNNANAAKRETWDELDASAWRAGLDASLNHYFTCTKTVAKYMLEDGHGAIVNNASIFGITAPNAAMYPEGIRGPSAHHAAAKAGILQLTRYLAAQWAGKGIRVNAISPGWFPQKRGPERPDFMREVNARIPMARIGQPAELVGAVVFLMSNAASYMTGQNLVVDGGYGLW
jgi:NAD(P)-dependent dehydrogenase (short-subunit alcohol dehydrogenase family)